MITILSIYFGISIWLVLVLSLDLYLSADWAQTEHVVGMYAVLFIPIIQLDLILPSIKSLKNSFETIKERINK